jgi:NAD+ kinase
MKYFAIIGDNHEKVKQLFLEKGYVEDIVQPDFVVSYGGDGTLLKSEEVYPSIPKLFIKNTKIGKLAQKKENQEILEKFFKGEISIKHVKKIEEHINKQTALYGAAEVCLHNADPRSGVRYTVRIDNEEIHHELIGDGVVVCNALGSTGYYKSITDSYFEVGIGLAFNNSTEQADHIVLSNHRRITITLTRGPGIIFADNQKECIALDAGDQIELFESSKVFSLIETP